MVFNGNNKLVMEALGIPLQNHKRVETISEKDLYEETFLKKEVDKIQPFLDANNSIRNDASSLSLRVSMPTRTCP